MKDFCVIGSGISGATIANHLSKKYIVEVYDKARGAGGRASNKKFNLKKSFDHGAQYISPKNIKFKRFVDNLISKKILKKWPGKHLFLKENIKENKKHIKIIGKNGNNAISKYLLKDINCFFNTFFKLKRRFPTKFLFYFSSVYSITKIMTSPIFYISD